MSPRVFHRPPRMAVADGGRRYYSPAMRTLMIDMPSGVAGDMLLGALLGCGGDLARLTQDLLLLGLGPIGITAKPVMRGSLSGLLVEVEAAQEPRWRPSPWVADANGARPGVPHLSLAVSKPVAGIAPTAPPPSPQPPTPAASPHPHHQHRPYSAIRDLLARAALPARARDRALLAFALLARAEGEVHGVAPDLVEFHEVGAIDAIADVVGCCLLLEQLDVGQVIIGPLLPGSGMVRCAHGLMPVPVPAVSAMLRHSRAPLRTLDWESGELTTPTGCALVVSLAEPYLAGRLRISTAAQRLLAVGYGAGHRDLSRLSNVVRCTILEDIVDGGASELVTELSCEIDDASGESLAVLMDELMKAGALDAYLTGISMKKGRPGHLLTVLTLPSERERFSALVLQQSSSIGVRWQLMERRVLPRRAATVVVEGQTIALKIVRLPDGSERIKPEADAVARAAQALNSSFTRLHDAAVRAYHEGASG